MSVNFFILSSTASFNVKFIYILFNIYQNRIVNIKFHTNYRDFTHNQNEDRSVNLNKLLDRFNPQIAKFITKRGLDPLYLPHSQRRLWVVRNALSYLEIIIECCLNDYSSYSNYLSGSKDFVVAY